ncbi:hypothetical protein FACS1894176_06300 [Bacteroidia bacterium]|nr:hypothetical protein FACS1894176_06300 [Bacteroidia bacterium]
MAAGATETITLQARVPANSTTTTYTNTVNVISSSPRDDNLSNNTFSVNTNVITDGDTGGGGG